uniref:Uncharacterized protein n=1 Tax=Ananas comosus var. bracteatus TaxID=296719 RepID=A0A6V7P9B2_ANACO|nr:unnamed protein product [Ananas comosus var. bracteatus]
MSAKGRDHAFDSPVGADPAKSAGSVFAGSRWRDPCPDPAQRRIRGWIRQSRSSSARIRPSRRDPSLPDHAGADLGPDPGRAQIWGRICLTVEGETSGQSEQQEPSLAQALGQMMRVLQVLDQNSHRSTARLDAVLAAITASNENIPRIGQLLTRNEQPTGCRKFRSTTRDSLGVTSSAANGNISAPKCRG